MKIKVSNKAKEMIQKTIDEKNITEPNIRIYISGIGWGGPTFGIALDEQKDNDFLEEKDGIKYLVEEELIQKYGGFEIDYSNGWLYRGFHVRPNSGGSFCS